MLSALLWLTVSTPFVYEAQQVQKEVQKDYKQYEDNNPFANTTEERNETNVNTFSEYLHEMHVTGYDMVSFVRYYKCHPSDVYFEYHPQLISPPPEV